MQLLWLALALWHFFNPTSSLAAEGWSCTDPQMRGQMNSAVQEKLALLGLPQMAGAPTIINKLHEAQSPRSLAILHKFQEVAHLQTETSRACEVDLVAGEDPMFITVLYINPHTGVPAGVVYNLGIGPVYVDFGDTSGM